MKKILIADDEGRMRKLVGDFLKREGYNVVEASNGREAIELFSKDESIEVAILDVMMPEFDGWTVCREIRKISKIPIIMLTARSEEADELFGFNLGADEYVTKPFSPNILVARVKALLRRVDDSENNIKAFNDLIIDRSGHYVSINGNAIDLSPKEFELLIFMVENIGKALSREQILNSVWDYDYFGDARTVDTHVKNLRLKLGEKSKFIQTVRGLGYRFEVKE